MLSVRRPPTVHPNGVIEGQVSVGDDTAFDAAVAADDLSRFIVAYETDPIGAGTRMVVQRFEAAGNCICNPGDDCPAAVSDDSAQGAHREASVAMTRGDALQPARVALAWITIPHFGTGDHRRVAQVEFDFDLAPFLPPQVAPGPPLINGPFDRQPSTGISVPGLSPVAFARPLDDQVDPDDNLQGLLIGDAGFLEPVRCCDSDMFCSGELCFPTVWQPSVAARSDGYFVVSWAEPEDLFDPFSPFNIALALYRSDGTLLVEIAGPEPDQWVNDPSLEGLNSSQLSPAVDFNDTGHIIVAYAGPRLDGCAGGSFRIFARRFFWNGDEQSPIEARSAMFIVDNDATPKSEPFNASIANPTVALTNSTDPNLAGRFIIAWNGRELLNDNVFAQYFEKDGRPLGRQFRVNQEPAVFDGRPRTLAESAQHTVAYPGDTPVFAWTHDTGVDFPDVVMFTKLPAGFGDARDALAPCLKGDVNRDGLVDGRDIQPFIDLLLGDTICLNIVELCPPDMNNDAALTIDDAPCFVDAVIAGVPMSCAESAALRGVPPGSDCNGNGVADTTDVFLGTSTDCNVNGVPDECDIDPADPDGNTLVSADVNANGVPDECEADCNGNGTPDDYDITSQTSDDVNTNGVPDECETDCNSNGTPDDWDIAQGTSADCNTNGSPDECEQDCNSNGVPDECDVDPSDPDGDLLVSADCNANGHPDECDLALPPGFGSLDCNTNGTPDECDIAACEGDPACADCNVNGIPDACDIAAAISEDANSNGTPDECESQQAQGGGGGGESAAMSGGEESTGESPVPQESTGPGAPGMLPDDAWAAFWEWSIDPEKGADPSLSADQKFAAMVAKMQELGLPVMSPWMALSAP